MRTVRRGLGNERGSVVVMVAVSLMAMLALGALAIDLASLRDARAESQRTADAIALAGATAFREFPSADAATSIAARDRAYEVAQLNKVRFDTLNVHDSTWVQNDYAWGTVYVSESQDVTLNVIPDSQKVRAWVRRKGIRTYFAKLLAFPFGHVETRATAWVTNNGPTVNCLKPFAMPDMWFESDTIAQDVNKNHYMEPITTVTGNEQDGESWKYQPASIGGDDYYLPYNPDVSEDPTHPQTGYGSGLRSSQQEQHPGDVGLPILLKPQTGGGNTDPADERMGNAFWLLNLDPDKNFKEEVGGCGSAGIGDSVPYDKGSKTAVRQAVDALNKLDPGARWDDVTNQVVGSSFLPNWTDSPRVVIVALIDPKYWIANSSNDKPDPGSTFTNFIRVFFEDIDPNGPPENIHARYVGPAPGGLGGPTGGPLVKVLQLIE